MMQNINYLLFENTPTLTVLDNRNLNVREIFYHRHPNALSVTDERITRHQFNAPEHLVRSIDPRLFDLQQTENKVKSNFIYFTSLSGGVLRTESVDAGTTVKLNDIAGRPALAISATGVTQTWQYEDTSLPGRQHSITEQAEDDSARVTERFIWAGNTQIDKDLKLAGKCARHL